MKGLSCGLQSCRATVASADAKTLMVYALVGLVGTMNEGNQTMLKLIKALRATLRFSRGMRAIADRHTVSAAKVDAVIVEVIGKGRTKP